MFFSHSISPSHFYNLLFGSAFLLLLTPYINETTTIFRALF